MWVGECQFSFFPWPNLPDSCYFLLGPSFIVFSLKPPHAWFTESVSVAQCIVVELQPSYFLDLSAHLCTVVMWQWLWCAVSCNPVDVLYFLLCLYVYLLFTVHGQHFFVDILCCHIFCPQKPHNSTLFCHGTRIWGRCHLVTAAPSLRSCAYRSLHVTIKLDSAAI